MGPRSFKRGNQSASASGSSPTASSFNGATLFQAWKQGISTDWARRYWGFNGATLFQAWKRLAFFWGYRLVIFASMGPRFFKRGNYTKIIRDSDHP